MFWDLWVSKLTLKSETFEVIEGFCVRCWGLGFGVGGGVFSDLLGVKIDAKKGDILGSLEVFVLCVGCWGWVVWEGKIYMTRIGFVTDFLGVKVDAKK